MEPKWLNPGAVLENGATLEGGAVSSLDNYVMYHETAPAVEPFWPHFLFSMNS